MKNNFLNKIKEKMPELFGEIQLVNVAGKTYLIKANVYSNTLSKEKIKNTITESFKELYPEAFHSLSLKLNNDLAVISNEYENEINEERNIDEVKIIYSGFLNVNLIKPCKKFKLNNNRKNSIDRCVKVLRFIEPIVLNRNLEIINGDMRLESAIENKIKEVYCVIIDADEVRADFLRLALNRLSEFQRWGFEQVDEYVDNTPQAQPLLEPMGFPGLRVLPESFFADTMLQYEIDPYNDQQKKYKQEIGLHEWAKIRRAEIEAEEKHKKEAKKKPVKNAISLFDLNPKEEDFLETYDIEKEVEEHLEKTREMADTITKNYDKKRKAEIEAKGGNWQNSRRSSAQKTADNRAAAEAKEKNNNLTKEEQENYYKNMQTLIDEEENSINAAIEMLENIDVDSEFMNLPETEIDEEYEDDIWG